MADAIEKCLCRGALVLRHVPQYLLMPAQQPIHRTVGSLSEGCENLVGLCRADPDRCDRRWGKGIEDASHKRVLNCARQTPESGAELPGAGDLSGFHGEASGDLSGNLA